MGKQKGRYYSALYEWGEAFSVGLTAAILLLTFVFHLNGVVGESMLPTLQDGDMLLLASNFIYQDPKPGDIIILRKNGFYNNKPIVKRVIATEGEMVDIDFEEGKVFVNGEYLEEPYINEPTYTKLDMEFPQTVPEGCVFVMGDNRNHSTDSRDLSLGMVDTRYILGHVLWRIFPVNGGNMTGQRRQ